MTKSLLLRQLALVCTSAFFLTACPSDDTNADGDDSSSDGGDDDDDDDDDDDSATMTDPTDPDSSSGGTDPDDSSTDPTDATESSTDPTDATESSTDPTDATESSSTDPSAGSTETGSEAMCLETTKNCAAPDDDCSCVGCNNDGTCSGADDDCVCADCDEDGFCGPKACDNNGSCDPYNEGCACADCYAHPECADNPQCGDDMIEGNEQCEGDDLNGADCESLGFSGGTLSCGEGCQYDTSACTIPDTWTCPVEYYGTDDGCDCGCGAFDPDCDGNTIDFCEYCGDEGSCDQTGMGCPGIIDPDDITACDPLVAWTCADASYGGDDGCDCGCGVVDPDCADPSVESCDTCNAEGSCDEAGGGCPGLIVEDNNSQCFVPVPAEWTCDEGYFNANDGCDCGCGAFDLDCADLTVESCNYCNDPGSCDEDGDGCPGDIDPENNIQCV